MSGLSILQAVVAFGILVFVHELGHFLVAKWIKVRVEVFSIGFGPALKKFKRGETEYRLCVIPLGGFVKMAGEETDSSRPPEPGDFYGKPVGQRALVFIAGVTMNLIFGFLFFMVAYQIGVGVTPAKVGGVIPGSSAWKAGLRHGDEIIAIKGVSSPVDFEDLMTSVMLSDAGESVNVVVRRGTEEFPASLKPSYDPDMGMKMTGISQPAQPVVAKLKANQREAFRHAFDLELQEKDRIVAVEIVGQEEPISVVTTDDFDRAISHCAGRAVTLFIQRGDSITRIRTTPRAEGNYRILGVNFGSTVIRELRGWALESALSQGDKLLAVAGKEVRSTTDVQEALNESAGREIDVLVDRQGKEMQLAMMVPAGKPGDDLAFEDSTVVDRTLPAYPAEEAGLQPGDRILAIDGKEVASRRDVIALVNKANGENITLSWVRDGKDMSATVAPQKPWDIQIPFELSREVVRVGLGRSIVLGGRKAFQWTARVYGSIKQLITGEVSLKLLSGPVSIARVAYMAAEQGVGTLFYIIGVLSINLAVMNLLPIPVLDGGHLLFAGIEKLRGKPVQEKVRAAATYVGLSLLVALLAVAFWNDIMSFFL